MDQGGKKYLGKKNYALPEDAEPQLLADEAAVSHITDLARHSETLKMALYQEPFGFQGIGEIQRASDEAFGAGSYNKWRQYFEAGELDQCNQIVLDAA